MSTPLNFDASKVQPAGIMELLPTGMYNVTITESEMKPTKTKGGAFLALTLTIMDGPYAGRKLFDNLNLQNSNKTAEKIAYETLSAICHATGVIQVQDAQQLHGIPMQCKVGLEAAGKGADGKEYDASNRVKGYKAIEGAQVPSYGGQPQQAAPAWAGQPQAAAPQQYYAQQQPPMQQPWQQPAPAQQQAPQGQPQQPWNQQPPQQAAPPAQPQPWQQNAAAAPQQQAAAPQGGQPTPPWMQQQPPMQQQAPAGSPPPWATQPQ